MGKRRSAGEGSLFFSKTENTWIGEINLADGSTKRKRSKKQSVVKEWLLAQRQAVKDNTFIKSDQITVSQFLDRYYNDVAIHTLRPTTLEGYDVLIRVHIKPALGNIKLTQLSAVHIQRFYSDELNSGLSPRTVQYIHCTLHKALDYAVRWNLVARNVSDLVDKPKAERKDVVPLTVEQVNTLLDTASTHRWYPIYVAACYMGLREGEVLGIHVEDLDFEKGILHVNHAVQQLRKQGVVVTEPKSKASKQPVYIPDYALQVLKNYVDQLESKRGLIFTTSSGKPIGSRNLIRHFKSLLKKAGLPDARFHDLRHTTASLLIKSGVHMKEIQYAMRHSQWNLTADTYSHLLPGMASSAAGRLNDLLGRELP
jgi:integrase